MRNKWDEMYRELVAFQKDNGHCNVSAADADCRKLGQWVSAQRYKGRIGALSQDKVDALNALGFVWSAADRTWQKMFRQLVDYAAQHKTTDIPERCPENQKLSNWVHNQRHRKKIGRLDADRIGQLEQIGFCWTAPNHGELDESSVAGAQHLPPDDSPAASLCDERLYHVHAGLYVQHSGKGRTLRVLREYAEKHHGEHPPYIPLPKGAVVFILGNEFYGGKRVPWSGKGPLPTEIMRYVQENGTLPRHEIGA